MLTGEPCDFGHDSLFFSTATRHFALGSTLDPQQAYQLELTPGTVDASDLSLPFSSGWDALDVDLDTENAVLSVAQRGAVRIGGVFQVLEQDRVYHYDFDSGSLTNLTAYDLPARGIRIGSLDALDLLADGTMAFSTASQTSVRHGGGFIVLRPENVYRFDPSTEVVELLFDARRMIGLRDLDAVDVIDDDHLAFSTATTHGVAHGGGFIVLRQQSVYVWNRNDNTVVPEFDGVASGLFDLDAVTLGRSRDLLATITGD